MQIVALLCDFVRYLVQVHLIKITIECKLREFNDYLDRRDFEKAKNILDELTDLLGEKNTDVVNAKIVYDFETIVL
ncbi:MAG: hypothetical protein IIT39_03050 [Clostridia bacterium]|nr:hypothetical protein [Clostridia bacterium]